MDSRLLVSLPSDVLQLGKDVVELRIRQSVARPPPRAVDVLPAVVPLLLARDAVILHHLRSPLRDKLVIQYLLPPARLLANQAGQNVHTELDEGDRVASVELERRREGGDFFSPKGHVARAVSVSATIRLSDPPS